MQEEKQTLPSIDDSSANPGILFLTLYKRYISKGFGDKCNFNPSCSQYSREAIKKYGLAKGIVMTTDRLSRCHYCAGPYYKRSKGRLIDKVEDNAL